MAGEVLRMKLIAKFELYALYQWQCCNAATTPSPEPSGREKTSFFSLLALILFISFDEIHF